MRRLDYYLGILILSAALVLAGRGWNSARATESTPPRIISAQAFELVDSSGKLRGALAALPDGSSRLMLPSVNGSVAIELGTTADGASRLLLRDKGGHLALRARVDSAGVPTVDLLDHAGKNRLTVGLEQNNPRIRLRGPDDRTRVSLSAVTDPHGAEDLGLVFSDRTETPQVILAADQSDVSLELLSHGQVTTRLYSEPPASKGGLQVLDPTRAILWEAPPVK